tara:strand:+ start:271 stop:531 length:261 start_codon:yes stop_codon:yes gene_type:complete
MNITAMKQVVEIFENLPTFETFAYYNESIKDVDYDTDGNVDKIHFYSGDYLKKIDIRTIGGSQTSWILFNSIEVIASFFPTCTTSV